MSMLSILQNSISQHSYQKIPNLVVFNTYVIGFLMEMDRLDEYLKTYFTSSFREGYGNFKGYTLPVAFKKMEQQIYDWDVREQDVWIITIPKAGKSFLIYSVYKFPSMSLHSLSISKLWIFYKFRKTSFSSEFSQSVCMCDIVCNNKSLNLYIKTNLDKDR